MPPPILRMRYPWSVAVSTIRRRWRIPIARVVTNAITGNCADDAGGVHFTHATVIGYPGSVHRHACPHPPLQHRLTRRRSLGCCRLCSQTVQHARKDTDHSSGRDLENHAGAIIRGKSLIVFPGLLTTLLVCKLVINFVVNRRACSTRWRNSCPVSCARFSPWGPGREPERRAGVMTAAPADLDRRS